MFKPDQPITSKSEDLLGRYAFSKALSEAIISYHRCSLKHLKV